MRRGLGQHLYRSPGGGFSPASLFANGEQGAWYDPSDLTTLFQDSAGTTPCTAVEQPVGLMLDKSKGLALGSELVTNGTFTTNTSGWSFQASATGSVVNSELQVTLSATTGTFTFQDIATVAGNWYRLDMTVRSAAGAITCAVYNGPFTTLLASRTVTPAGANTTVTLYFAATGTTTRLGFGSDANSNTYFADNVTIKALPGNHAFQTTSTSRPTLRARYNLLTYSEQFDDAAWGGKTTLNTTGTPPWVNVAVAPDGTTTAEKLIPTAVNNYHGVTSVAFVAGTYTISVYAKAAEYSKVFVGTFAGATISRGFDLTTGQTFAITGATAPNSWSMVDAGNGWWRCSVSVTTAVSDNVLLGVLTSASISFTGDGTSGIFIWGAQLLTAADVTATGNAYQRIADAATYDTSNPVFRPYLSFDGVDDFLVSANIDLTVTTRVTAFVGATKNNDSNVFAIVDFGASGSGTAGGFSMWAGSPTAGGAAVWAASFQSSAGGGALNIISPANFAAPATGVITTSLDVVNAGSNLRVNGTLQTTSASDPPDGTFGNIPLRLSRTGPNGLPGRIYSAIIRGAASTAAEISSTESWVNQKTGAY